MATATLFYDSKRNFGVDTITFDLLLNESHELPVEVTSHRIEQGSEISDHIELPFFSGSVTGFVSNFSLSSAGSVSNRAQAAFQALEKLRLERRLVTIVTGLKVYTDVAITGISTNREAGTGEALSFRITFQQVRKVRLRTVRIEASINITDMDSDLNRQAAANADQGRTIAEFGATPLSEYESFNNVRMVR